MQLLLHFVVVNMLNYVDRGVVAGVLPTLRTEFSLDSPQAGFLGSSFVFSYMIFSLPFAKLAQRFPPFILMGVGLSCWVASAVLAYFSRTFEMLLVARSLFSLLHDFFSGFHPLFVTPAPVLTPAPCRCTKRPGRSIVSVRTTPAPAFARHAVIIRLTGAWPRLSSMIMHRMSSVARG
jgi:MFS family permease